MVKCWSLLRGVLLVIALLACLLLGRMVLLDHESSSFSFEPPVIPIQSENETLPAWSPPNDTEVEMVLSHLQNFEVPPIFIAIVAMGSEDHGKAMTLIKSILQFYDFRAPLTFFIVTESTAMEFPLKSTDCIKVIPVQVNVALYKKFLDETKFETIHYSSLFAFYKLFVRDMLPQRVTQVLVIDSDILFLRNVRDLWEEAIALDKPLAAVCQMDAYRVSFYCGSDNQKQFCHPERYCNSGMVFYDFNKNSSIGSTEWWIQMTKQLVEKGRATKRVFRVADQDVFNFVAATTPEYIGFISCEWGCDPGTHKPTGLDQRRCPDKVCSLVHLLAKTYRTNQENGAFYQYFWAAFESLDQRLVLKSCQSKR